MEVGGQAAKLAREHFGIHVYEGTLEQAGLPVDAFDAVTMNHVVVVVTPNVESLGHRLFRDAWRGLEAPRHLVLFSPDALRCCAERASLAVRTAKTTARGAPFFWQANQALARGSAVRDHALVASP